MIQKENRQITIFFSKNSQITKYIHKIMEQAADACIDRTFSGPGLFLLRRLSVASRHKKWTPSIAAPHRQEPAQDDGLKEHLRRGLRSIAVQSIVGGHHLVSYIGPRRIGSFTYRSQQCV